MKRTEKLTSTSNEFLARKKNVSEEVKLREAIASLEFKRSLTKDALRQDVGKVKTDLRQIRRSTGHSIEALPPTPFRLMARRYSIMPAPDMPQDYLASCVSPEFHYMLDEIYDAVGVNADDFDGAVKLPAIYNNGQDRTKVLAPKGETVRIVTFIEPQDESQIAMKLSEQNLNNDGSLQPNHKVSSENEFHLPHLPQQGNASLINKQQATKDFLSVPDWDLRPLPSPDVALPLLVGAQRELSDISLSPRISTRQSAERSPDSPEDSRDSENGSPVSKRLLAILSEGEWKRQEYVRKNSIAGFDSLAAQLVARRALDESLKKGSVNQGKNGKHGSTKAKQEDPRAHTYRDARTRCRTCMERFRQNAAFQRQKLEQEILAAKQIQLPSDRKRSNGNASLRKGSLFLSSDLEQYFSDEVLDFDDEKEKKSEYTSRKKRKCKGYSRKRLNELAEPRKGTRRKTLFSKRLITKEVDTLTQTHDQPQLTDREKERLRMLDSVATEVPPEITILQAFLTAPVPRAKAEGPRGGRGGPGVE
ncbi:hypothetical protein EGW08_002159 [Elysia chlorotica]|uniref:Uncharacterized protein n=1 Tax=Elysia chlorotica TaxID=188477 RepID=A0A433U8H6_ELYCH|nr:hypothetical protein EGW08_002159 [Elysia chlorotica]